jgi:hypothetical protein
MPLFIESNAGNITLGEICNTLRVVWGRKACGRRVLVISCLLKQENKMPGWHTKFSSSGLGRCPPGWNMNNRQRHLLCVLASICLGSMAFCLTLLLAFVLEAILLSLLGLLEGNGFVPPEFAVLFLISTLVGIIAAHLVELNYYRSVINRGNT